MEVDEATLQEASVEVPRPRKVIRVESEETQDFVRETLAIRKKQTIWASCQVT